MADTQASLDAWKKQKETLTGAGQPVPESLVKNIEEAQWQLQELGITGDVVANKIRTTLQGAFANSFKDFISGAKSASEAMQSFAMTILDSAMQIMANKIAMMFLSKVAGIPGLSFLGGAEAAVPSAKGNVISDGKVKPFAKGGIVASPTLFPLRNATGLMGEAGPEAIIPLQRGKDGKLGVAGGQGTSYNTVNNISVTIEKYTGKDDPETTAAKIAEAISRRIAKEEIASASRKGGRLAPVGAF
jgi:phage-related minor tail protein